MASRDHDHTAGGALDDGAKCPACFRPLVTETVQILQGQRYTPEAKWVDSSVQRCEACKHTFGGTLEDRLAYIAGVYGYKYFGDYELNDEQSDAVWKASAIANLVPELLEALKAAEELYQLGVLNAPDGLFERVKTLRRAAIAKAEGRS